jgi:hypothetical protein
MDRLSLLLSECASVGNSLAQERDAARVREAELACALDAERAAASDREASLVNANERLLAQVEDLSSALAKMQGQVSMDR